MDTLRYRWKARFVGELDRIVTLVAIFFTLLHILRALSVTALLVMEFKAGKNLTRPQKDLILLPGLSGDDNDENRRGYEHRTFAFILVGFVWFFLILSLILEMVELLAASRLIQATEIGLDPIIAEKNASFWLRVSIVLTVLTGLGLFGGGFVSQIVSLIHLCLRLVAIVIVQRFVLEVKRLNLDPTFIPGRIGEPEVTFYNVEGQTNPNSNSESGGKVYVNCHQKPGFGQGPCNGSGNPYASIYQY